MSGSRDVGRSFERFGNFLIAEESPYGSNKVPEHRALAPLLTCSIEHLIDDVGNFLGVITWVNPIFFASRRQTCGVDVCGQILLQLMLQCVGEMRVTVANMVGRWSGVELIVWFCQLDERQVDAR